MAKFAISTVISAIDNVTGPLAGINKSLKDFMKPIRDLHASTQKLKKELGFPKVAASIRGVSKAYSGVASQVKSLGTELAMVTGAATAAVSALAWRTSSVGDAVAKTSQKVGISAEAWSALAYAGDQSGVAASTLQGGLTRLNKNLSEAATGNKTASAMFDRLGISIYDANGNLKTADSAMSEVADKLNTVEDAAHRSRLAAEFFGRSAGPEMIPLLAEGSEGIENLKRRAAELGLVWNGVDSKNAEKFGDTMEDVKNALDGVVFTIGKQLLPILTKWGNDVIGLITKHRELIGVKVSEWLQRFNEYLPTLEGHIANLWSQVSGFALKVDSIVQSFGGWGAVMPYVIGGLAAIKLAPLALSVVTLTKSIAGLGWALGTMGYKFATLIKLPQLLIGGLKLFANMFLGIGGAVKAILVPLAQGIVGFGKGVVIVGKVLGGMLVKGLLAATVALKTFFVFMLTNPIGWVIAAVAALAAAAYYIYKNWDWIGSWFKNLWEGIKEVAGAAWEWIKNAASSVWTAIVETIKSVFSPIVDYFTERIDAVKSAFDTGLIAGIQAIILNFHPVRWIVDAMDALTKYLFDFSLKDAGVAVINSILDGFKSAWGGVASWLSSSVSGLTDWMPDFVKNGLGLSGFNSGAIPSGISSSGQASVERSPALQAAKRHYAIQQTGIQASANIAFEANNVPPGVNINAKNFTSQRIQYQQSDPYYVGGRMIPGS